jgi:hypothetical protein
MKKVHIARGDFSQIPFRDGNSGDIARENLRIGVGRN